jgi:glycosyltransferase involved in cell wall biosynthesis
MKRLLAFAHAVADPACRFRVTQYFPLLAEAGWRPSLSTQHPPHPWERPFRSAAVRNVYRRAAFWTRRTRRVRDIRSAPAYDAILLNRDLLQQRIEYERLLLRLNPRVVFDVDDAIHLGAGEAHARWICERAAWVTAGNETLASFARQFTDRVTVLPTVVDTDAYETAVHRQDGRVRVGWLGSGRSIEQTLRPFLPLMAALQAERHFRFVVVTKPRPAIPCPGLEWEFVEWSPETEVRIARHLDIGIMPLADEPFQRAKCGCKLLQYFAAGLPAVASPVGVNTSLVGHRERGILAATPAGWRSAIGDLIGDAALRARLGAAARRFVEKEYSRRTWFPVLLDVLERVRTEPSRAVTV